MNKPVLTRADSRRRHRALIDAATELFLEFGYSTVTMDQVVERAGGSKRTIYSYFHNKEGLIIAVFDDMVQEILIPIHSVILDEERDLHESLTEIADITLAALLTDKGIGLSRIAYSESVKLPAVGKALYMHGPNRAINELKKYLKSLADSGKIKCEDPALASEFFWGMLLHLPMLQGLCSLPALTSTRSRKKHVSRVVDNFIRGFTT